MTHRLVSTCLSESGSDSAPNLSKLVGTVKLSAVATKIVTASAIMLAISTLAQNVTRRSSTALARVLPVWYGLVASGVTVLIISNADGWPPLFSRTPSPLWGDMSSMSSPPSSSSFRFSSSSRHRGSSLAIPSPVASSKTSCAGEDSRGDSMPVSCCIVAGDGSVTRLDEEPSSLASGPGGSGRFCLAPPWSGLYCCLGAGSGRWCASPAVKGL
mmetsp:Transcript_6265/g.14764  ORF Transcript_6265/g.14764 Transcript_6265/m.14764 type:complete len:214 (-) Transcript_6265:1809-2450(-)